jgi:hypothetical protein
MVFINGKQILEGIDKITVIMHPSLDNCYNFKCIKYIIINNRLAIRRNMKREL